MNVENINETEATNEVSEVSEDNDDEISERVTTYENPTAKVLRGFSNISYETISSILASSVEYKDLSALNEEDLKLFGVQDEATRTDVVQQLKTILNQDYHLEKYMAELHVDDYRETVYKNTYDHLQRIELALDAAQVQMCANPMVDNLLIDDNVYTTTAIIKALQQIKVTAIDMRHRQEKKPKKRNSIWRTSSIGCFALLSSYLLYKIIFKR